MSHLRIKTRSGQQVNPDFSELFIKIVEGNYYSYQAIDSKQALLLNGLAEPESVQENKDIVNMTMFLILSNQMLAVKWGDRYYFGDVDLMDNYDFDESMDDVTLVQYCIEDELTLKTIFKMFEKINDDCMRAGEDAVPLDAKEYYSEQIQNVYDIDETTADMWAEQMRKFIIFQQSGRDVPDTNKYTGEDNGVQPGRVYLADSTDTCGLVIDDSSGWFHEDNNPEHWHLLVANQEWMSNELSDLEFELFDFAISAGWTDDL